MFPKTVHIHEWLNSHCSDPRNAVETTVPKKRRKSQRKTKKKSREAQKSLKRKPKHKNKIKRGRRKTKRDTNNDKPVRKFVKITDGKNGEPDVYRLTGMAEGEVFRNCDSTDPEDSDRTVAEPHLITPPRG